MTLLPATYLGGTEWFSRVVAGDVVMDIGERWVKQTARNRCEILTSGGVAALTVPVHAGGGGSGAGRVATKDVRIDHSKRWARVHWQSMVSAYRSAPFFDHYAGRFEPVFCARRHEFLVDLDLELLEIVLQILRLPLPRISSAWVEPAPGDIDLRGKKALRRSAAALSTNSGTPLLQVGEYTQVFADRLPFTPGLSIVDLIFAEGPAARDHLR